MTNPKGISDESELHLYEGKTSLREPMDAFDVAEEIEKLWAEMARGRMNAAVLGKNIGKIPVFTITEYGIDPVRDVYLDPHFGIMIDGRLK